MRVSQYEHERQMRLYHDDPAAYNAETYDNDPGEPMIDEQHTPPQDDFDDIENFRLQKMLQLVRERGEVRVYSPINPKSLDPARVLDVITNQPDMQLEHRGSDLYVVLNAQNDEKSILEILRENKFTIKRQGTEFVTFKGLLYVAKQHGGLQSMTSELVKEASDFTASDFVFKATVTGSRGTAQAYGDANPHNVGAMVAPHVLRMAESRAYVRALRFYLGVGLCGLEEIFEDKSDS